MRVFLCLIEVENLAVDSAAGHAVGMQSDPNSVWVGSFLLRPKYWAAELGLELAYWKERPSPVDFLPKHWAAELDLEFAYWKEKPRPVDAVDR